MSVSWQWMSFRALQGCVDDLIAEIKDQSFVIHVELGLLLIGGVLMVWKQSVPVRFGPELIAESCVAVLVIQADRLA